MALYITVLKKQGHVSMPHGNTEYFGRVLEAYFAS